MATPAELAFERTDLDEEQLDHLQRLLGTWGILSDLSFSDLLLLAPMAPGATEPRRRRARAGHPRPDAPDHERHGGRARPRRPDGRRRGLAAGRAHRSDRARSSGRGGLEPGASRSASTASRCGARARRWPSWPGCRPAPAARPGHLERIYRDLFDRLAAMVAEATFPSRARTWPPRGAPGGRRAWSWSTRRAGSATPRPTPSAPCTAWACTPDRGPAPHRPGHRGVGHRLGAGLGLPGGRGGGAPPDVTVLLHCIP